jgi:3-hydroxyacyl-CoA dehydrogenase
MIPEISDRVVEIDRAMRWGYANKLGPFELWDTLGFVDVITRLETEQPSNSAGVKKALSHGVFSLYKHADKQGRPETNTSISTRRDISLSRPRDGIIVLSDLKRSQGVVKQNAGASLVDLGDGVLCVEFHSKMNALGEDNIGMLYAGLSKKPKRISMPW